MKGLAPSQIALLNHLYAQAGASTIPGDWLVAGSVDVTKLDLATLNTLYAPFSLSAEVDSLEATLVASITSVSNRVSVIEPLANSAVQPTDNWTSTVNGVAASTLTTNAANGNTAYGWGDHALAGYALASGDWTSTVNGVAAATLTSNAANGNTAYGWGNHALAGYLTTAPVTKLYQATATGATPETFTLPATPSTGSEVIVFVEGVPHHLTATDPPAAGDFYRSGTTVKVDTVASDRVSIYYSGNP